MNVTNTAEGEERMPKSKEFCEVLEAASAAHLPDVGGIYKALLKSTFVVPLASEPKSQQAGELVFLTLNEHGRQTLFAFTDQHKLVEYCRGGNGAVELSGLNLCRLGMNLGIDQIVVNPGGPVHFPMLRQEFESVAEGMVPLDDGSMQSDQHVEIEILPTQAHVISGDRLGVLRRAVSISGVDEVYVVTARISGGGPHLGLAVSSANPEALERMRISVSQVSARLFGNAESLYLFTLQPDDVTSETMRSLGTLIYKSP